MDPLEATLLIDLAMDMILEDMMFPIGGVNMEKSFKYGGLTFGGGRFGGVAGNTANSQGIRSSRFGCD